MKQFQAAAKRDGDQEWLEPIKIRMPDGEVEEFPIRSATTGQISLVASALDTGGVEMVGSAYTFLRALMEPADYRRLRQLVADGVVSFELLIGGDDLNEEGIIDGIIEDSTRRPTKAPTDYLPSQKPGGQRSTGRSPGRGSTRSASAHAAS